MRIAVFSDIHGNLPAMKSIIDDIKNNNIDRIIYLGDVIGIGPEPDKCLDLIIENNIEMVLGNHELYYVKGMAIDKEIGEHERKHHNWIHSRLSSKHYEFLSNRPLSIKVEENGYKLLFQHFLIDDEKIDKYPFYGFNVLKENIINTLVDELDFDYTFIGHEHRPYEVEYNNKKLIDSGSSGCVYNDITHYTVIEIKDDVEVSRKEVKYNRDELIEAFSLVDYALRDYLSENFFGIINK